MYTVLFTVVEKICDNKKTKRYWKCKTCTETTSYIFISSVKLKEKIATFLRIFISFVVVDNISVFSKHMRKIK